MNYFVWHKNGWVRFFKGVRSIQFEKNGFMRFCIDPAGEKDEFVAIEDVVRIQAIGGCMGGTF